MEEQYTIPEPDVTPVEVSPVEPVPVEETVTAEPAEVTEPVQEAPALTACDSCGAVGELFDVPHHQVGNPTVWHYCARCKAVHDGEVRVIAELKELAQTYPAQADTPRVSGMLHEGQSVEEVKATIERERQPELEAEVVAQ